MRIDGLPVKLSVRMYNPNIILIEGSLSVQDIFDINLLNLKDKLLDVCYELAKKRGGSEEMAEEYTIYQFFGYKGDPETILKSKSEIIAGLLKSETIELDEKEKEIKELIKIRSQAVTKFDAVERDIELIGDWYLAHLYDLISKKFYLNEWRNKVKEKMDSLEDIYTIASGNLGMSRMQTLELI